MTRTAERIGMVQPDFADLKSTAHLKYCRFEEHCTFETSKGTPTIGAIPKK